VLNAISKFIRELRRPRLFDSVQVEVTSRCNAKCIMCPRTTLDGWQNGDMPLDTFLSMATCFELANHIHLQGWGEPLLHTELGKMIQSVKSTDTKVGFTTNGQLLSSEKAKEYIDLNLDIIAVSLAGADKQSHEAIRMGTDFERIIKNIHDISDLKAQRRSKLPSVIISFIMLRSNIDQLSKVIELAAGLGADRIVATNVDFITCHEIEKLKIFDLKDGNREEDNYNKLIKSAEKTAAAKKIALKVYPTRSEEQPVCEADPLNNIYISFDGCLFPCVYLGLPVPEIPRFADGKTATINRVCFGDLKKESVTEIWKKERYVQFRKTFRKRKTASILTTILKTFLAEPGPSPEDTAQHSPPECLGCYKLFGA